MGRSLGASFTDVQWIVSAYVLTYAALLMASGNEISRPQPETPRFGMRLWLTGAFAAVSLITAATVYFFGESHQAL